MDFHADYDDLLATLADMEGLTEDQLVQGAFIRSTCPGICSRPGCYGIMTVEPDQDAGWCEVCDGQTVISALRLAGLA